MQRILKEQGPRFVIKAGRGDLAGLSRPEPEADGEGDDLDRVLCSQCGEPASEVSRR